MKHDVNAGDKILWKKLYLFNQSIGTCNSIIHQSSFLSSFSSYSINLEIEKKYQHYICNLSRHWFPKDIGFFRICSLTFVVRCRNRNVQSLSDLAFAWKIQESFFSFSTSQVWVWEWSGLCYSLDTNFLRDMIKIVAEIAIQEPKNNWM